MEEAEGEESDAGGSRGAWIGLVGVLCLSAGTGLGALTLVQPQREEAKDARGRLGRQQGCETTGARERHRSVQRSVQHLL
ncbi:hypothetical protein NDU88_001608 [Pleurodeles waltl]|uniref:Uncharacterized protein n=1 Tax=Pleurodeles waltl TaxID=8319 RepID=A0AAV7W210_PLEWA|nr:hypothetical protein NDU88_001608 [Pleurodeles waltl]